MSNTKYPTMSRPKRKLCYFTNMDSSVKKRVGTLTLEDIDKMFDDIDQSVPNEDDSISLCPLVQTFDTETKENEKEVPPVSKERQLTEKLSEVDLRPTTRTPSPKQDIDLDISFKVHEPVKTSSPIEERLVSDRVEELERKDEKGRVASPILFDCEDEEKEEAKAEPLPNQGNGHVTEHDDFELEPPPCRVVLSRLKVQSHENKGEGLRGKESHPVKETAPKKPQTAVLEAKSKAPRPENPAQRVAAVRQEPEVAAPKKKSESVVGPPLEGKDMSTFLQKLRDAAQPKPACKMPSSVKAAPPPPPEPEEDFLILEDDAPLWFSIPSKTSTSKKQRLNRSSNTDKDSSTERDAKDVPLDSAPKQQESLQENGKPRSQSDDQKMKKVKGREEKNKVTELGNNMDDFCSPEEQDPPTDDATNQEKANKKNRLKKVLSKESDTSEKQPKDAASRKTDEEQKVEIKMDRKAQKSSDMKRSKSIKDGNEKSSKGAKKWIKGSGSVKETVHVDAVEEVNQQHADDAEEPGSVSDKDIMAQKSDEDEHNRPPAVTEEGSSDDSLITGRRKRKPPGQWWMSSGEDTEGVDSGPKRSKQNNKEPQAAAAAAALARKRVSKKSRQSQPATSSGQNTNKAKEKKSSNSRDTPHKMKATEESSDVTDAGQIEQQEEVTDQDQDSIHSSPLIFPPREHSQSSADQVFQKTYHALPEKTPIRPAPVSSKGSRNLAEQLRTAEADKRRRKRPSNWWAVNGLTEDEEDVASQPPRQEPKPHKERKKRSRQIKSHGLVAPKKDNKADSAKPPGGTPVAPLKVKMLFAPKNVKRSLSTYKDIYASTPTVVGSGDAGQIDGRKARAPPAVEVTVTDCTDHSKTDGGNPSEDAGQSDSPPNDAALQDSKCQLENTFPALRSGPSSMVDLEHYEEDLILPSSRHQAALSASDLFAPPLKPLSLQPKDKANLREWFKSLWSATVDNGSEITPDQFDWFFYQGKAIGFLVDLDCGSICNGKILLGSYMKKPLWVDHSATTVFNLLTSSVSVTIDGKESRYNPGQSFMVPCGHAYSIRNVVAQPAVLYFTRILAESSD